MLRDFKNKYTKYQYHRYTFEVFKRNLIMRKAFIISVLFIALSCASDDDARNNPFLVDLAFQVELNTNLPQYSTLNFPGNSVIVNSGGLRGFVIYHPGNSQYFAYELSDPNHSPNECSKMTVSGITASCPCTDDNNEYSIFNGQPTQGGGQYGLKAYRVERSGNIIRVFN
ncbi:hypothetical protein BBFL7_01672 [Flavobacteria bacterium BBFL7]|nr:hypothetical protein BBFL7_01672 [Flavobacteria bacterium BBFL7]